MIYERVWLGQGVLLNGLAATTCVRHKSVLLVKHRSSQSFPSSCSLLRIFRTVGVHLGAVQRAARPRLREVKWGDACAWSDRHHSTNPCRRTCLRSAWNDAGRTHIRNPSRRNRRTLLGRWDCLVNRVCARGVGAAEFKHRSRHAISSLNLLLLLSVIDGRSDPLAELATRHLIIVDRS